MSAFGRRYQIVVADGSLTERDENGELWDPLGLPDVFVTLALNGTVLGSTEARQDTLTPVWNQAAEAVIPAGSNLQVDVIDEDLNVNDLMYSCTWPLTAELLRGGGFSCIGSGALSGNLVVIEIWRL